MSDVISRQAAKDMIKNHKSDFSTEKDYRTARACVNAVPPAQPEIIRCKDCRKNPNWEWVGCPMAGKNTRKPDDFCSYAERREVTA